MIVNCAVAVWYVVVLSITPCPAVISVIVNCAVAVWDAVVFVHNNVTSCYIYDMTVNCAVAEWYVIVLCITPRPAVISETRRSRSPSID